eukprot:TRINITY_DN3576_c0_g1_i3.p1 TRINITY_DN3576_c0_g1~~TRINITY_DN3576_c0_g1_i3.p1  ORF type:complete len:294 (+),score=-2.93 TRINITY_DN3576_c0_g1_i3:221-1102(+)
MNDNLEVVEAKQREIATIQSSFAQLKEKSKRMELEMGRLEGENLRLRTPTKSDQSYIPRMADYVARTRPDSLSRTMENFSSPRRTTEADQEVKKEIESLCQHTQLLKSQNKSIQNELDRFADTNERVCIELVQSCFFKCFSFQFIIKTPYFSLLYNQCVGELLILELNVLNSLLDFFREALASILASSYLKLSLQPDKVDYISLRLCSFPSKEGFHFRTSIFKISLSLFNVLFSPSSCSMSVLQFSILVSNAVEQSFKRSLSSSIFCIFSAMFFIFPLLNSIFVLFQTTTYKY